MFKNRIKLLDKYIIKEIFYPFLASVIIITIILIGNYLFQLTDLIIVKEVPIYLVMRLLFYNLPDVIVRTFPIAILFSTMTGIGRLNRENEITAFRMGGISLYRLIIPVLIIGVLISGVTLLFNEEIVPWSNHKAQNIIRNTILKENMPETQEEVFFRGPKGRLFYVKSYDEKNNTLDNIIIYNITNNNEEGYPEVITANKGIIKENVWELQNGIIHEYNDEGNIILESKFNQMEFAITEEMQEIYGNQKTTSEMSREELAKNIKLFRQSGINVNSLLVDYHLKLAQPLVAFIFVLIAVPLSLTNKKSRAINITFTIIIIFAYYLILSICRSLGKNQILPPLVAAWLPNIIFFMLGLLILFWQESLEKFIYKIIPGIIIFLILVCIIPTGTVMAADKLYISSDSIRYDQEQNLIEISGNVDGRYEKIYLKSDLIKIKTDEQQTDIFSTPNQIELLPGQITGCDYEEPHYFFDAEKVVISPNKYLKAYNVVFKELGGKLPLFYWPYLYISLRDREQDLFYRIGYNSRRGWFIKSTYNYYIDQLDLPGSVYLDYYTLSGFAGGVKQYFINSESQEAYIYYYTQDNNIGIPNLFNWEGELYHKYEGDIWNEEFNYFYQEYDNKEISDIRLSLNDNSDDFNIRLNSYYDNQNFYDSNVNDIISYGSRVRYSDSFFDKHFIDLSYDIDYDYDPEEGTEEYNAKRINIRNNWGNNLETGFNLEEEQQIEPDEGAKTRWDGKGYISKKAGKFNYMLLYERYDPQFSEEDEVAFFKSPEVSIEYDATNSIDLLLQTGYYYESESDIKGHRTRAEFIYDNRLNLNRSNYLNVKQNFHYNIYDVVYEGEIYKPYQAVSESDISLISNLGNYISLTNSLQQEGYLGYSPFNFDQAQIESIMENNVAINFNNRFNLELNTGYDFIKEKYLLLDIFANLEIIDNWNIRLGTTYNLNQDTFAENMYLTSYYNGSKLNHRLGLEYNLNESSLAQLDSNISYEIPGDWGWSLENNLSYNFNQEDAIQEANIQLKKKLHCREIVFSYDYIKDEYTFQYQINLFPSEGIEFIKTEDQLIFDSNIEDLIDTSD